MTKMPEQQWSHHEPSNNSADTITSRFERQVTAVPDKLAIVTDEISLTYRALDLRASRIAAALASLSPQRERPLAIFIKSAMGRLFWEGTEASIVAIRLAFRSSAL